MSSSLDKRVLVQEILDVLPFNDERAQVSRRDLVWINALMFQSRIMASLLRKHVLATPRRILELGSGDGSFMLAVARQMGESWSGVELVMIDQVSLVTEHLRKSFAALGWRVTTIKIDIGEWLAGAETEKFDVTCTNLVLHHFKDERIAGIFASLSKTSRVVAATEPRRNVVTLAGCSMLRLIGANDVTMHDAAASVRAGFQGTELSALWPGVRGSTTIERPRGPFTHTFVAKAAPDVV